MTTLPADFEETLKDLREKGILDESGDELRHRMLLQVAEIRDVKRMSVKDLGGMDWGRDLLNSLQAGVYREICDPEKRELKAAYLEGMNRTLTPSGIGAVAAVVIDVARAINPAFAVSSLGIYMAAWLLKVGLNYWCSLPAPVAK